MLDISMLFTSWILADLVSGAELALNIYSSMLPILAVNLGILTVSGFYGADEKLNRFAKLFKSLTVAQIVLLTIAFFYKPKLWALHSVILTAWPLNFVFIGGARFLFYLSMIQIRKRIPLFQQSIVLIRNQVDEIDVNTD
jgi:FlaA1/EpsC-like NDP-sugar epimerase